MCERKEKVSSQLDTDMGWTKKKCLCVECIARNRKCYF